MQGGRTPNKDSKCADAHTHAFVESNGGLPVKIWFRLLCLLLLYPKQNGFKLTDETLANRQLANKQRASIRLGMHASSSL
jgi:hypothetical protein